MELRPNTNYPRSDPRYHTANVLAALDDLIRHLREDTREFDEPKAQALFETSAEVLGGLRTAFPALRERSGSGDARAARALVRHAFIAKPFHRAHVAEPWATVNGLLPVASQRVTQPPA